MNCVNLIKYTLSALLVVWGTAQAGEQVDKSLQVDDDGIIEIENVRGEVVVVGSSQSQVTVKGELDDMATGLVFETKGKVTTVKVTMPRGDLDRGDGSNLSISVPGNSKVNFEGVSSDFTVSKINAGIDVITVNGDIHASEIAQSLQIRTVSGDITAEKSSGPAQLETVSGDVTAQLASMEVEANSVSGDFDLQLSEFKDLDASVVNGDISLQGYWIDGGKISFSSVNGDVHMKLDGSLNARVKVETGPGGEIINKLSDDRVTTIFPNQEKLVMTLGDGSGSIKAGTVNGTITLEHKKGLSSTQPTVVIE